MNKNGKIIATIVSALLVIVIAITLGMKLNEKKDSKSLSNSNSTKNREIEIQNTCPANSVAPDAIEKYYEDEKYVCTFNQVVSGCYIVKVDGKEYSLRDALNNKVITIEEGIEHGLHCERKDTGVDDNQESNSNSNMPSNTNSNSNSSSNTNVNTNTNTNTNTISNIQSNSNVVSNTNSNKTSNSNKLSNSNVISNVNKVSNSNIVGTRKISVVNKCSGYLTQQIDYFYEDNQYKYYFNSGMSSCTYVNVNGKEYPLRNALNQKIVTIQELEAVGFKCLKESKNLVEK